MIQLFFGTRPLRTTMMDAVDEVSKLKKALTKAIKEENTERAIEILEKLKKDVVPTKELLKKTEIGFYIHKQRTHENVKIATLSKDIVKKWRTDLNGVSSSPNSKTSASKASLKSNNKSNSNEPTNGLHRSSSQSSISVPATPASSETPSSENGGERSVAMDEVKIPTTGDSKRDNIIELLYNALVFDSSVDSEIVLKRAVKIESQILTQFGSPEKKEYRDKLRGLILNLKDKKNPGLRHSVVNGELPVQTLCTMSKEDMASEEKKARDREIRQEMLFKARGAGEAQAETDMFRCGKCGKRKTTYFQMQTRSADEPMTTFVTCVNCQNRWKFC